MIVILLPALNEEKSLPVLMPKLQRTMADYGEEFRMIVCDDGSADKTLALLEKYSEIMPIEIIYHDINRGLGESSRDLFERAVKITKAGDVIIRLDCDDTHEPEIIPKIIKEVRKGYDVVVASRFAPGGGQLGVSTYRAFVSHSANLFMKVFFPIKNLHEYSCGFRGYSAAKMHEAINFYGNNFIQLKGLGFTGTLEKLVKLKLIGAKFSEVPFILRYDQKQSESKMVSSITTFGYLVMTILYHWPWGGWRTGIKKKYRKRNFSNEKS